MARISDPNLWVSHDGAKAYVTGAPHADSGLVTLLAQDGVSGLQAKAQDGRWIDVPPMENTLAVNFGRLLERWTGGGIKATLHRLYGDHVGAATTKFVEFAGMENLRPPRGPPT